MQEPLSQDASPREGRSARGRTCLRRRGACHAACGRGCPVGGEWESTKRLTACELYGAVIPGSSRLRASSLCNLVDPASSHMLVSKTKPCMSKYKLVYGETANGSLKQL